MPSLRSLVPLTVLVLLMPGLAGCATYDVYEGRIANHDHQAHWYAIEVYADVGERRRHVFQKSLPVAALGTSFLGRITDDEGNYTVDVTMDNVTRVAATKPFDRLQGPGFFQITTRAGNLTIEFGFV